jgi:hypothetical protein
MDLVFIAIPIGELHTGLAWDVRVITSSKQLNQESRVEVDQSVFIAIDSIMLSFLLIKCIKL